MDLHDPPCPTADLFEALRLRHAEVRVMARADLGVVQFAVAPDAEHHHLAHERHGEARTVRIATGPTASIETTTITRLLFASTSDGLYVIDTLRDAESREVAEGLNVTATQPAPRWSWLRLPAGRLSVQRTVARRPRRTARRTR